MRAEIRNKIELWWIPENDDPAVVGEVEDGAPVYVCEDVTDVDAVAAYLVTLRIVQESPTVPLCNNRLPAETAIRACADLTEIIYRIIDEPSARPALTKQ